MRNRWEKIKAEKQLNLEAYKKDAWLYLSELEPVIELGLASMPKPVEIPVQAKPEPKKAKSVKVPTKKKATKVIAVRGGKSVTKKAKKSH